MQKYKIELHKTKFDTVNHYNDLYQNFLREAVKSNECITEGFIELTNVKYAIGEYAKAFHITPAGIDTKDNSGLEIRPDVVYRCARLMYCVSEKTPARPSKTVSKTCYIGSYGLKHVLEYWIGRLSDNTVALPFPTASTSYVSNGEAILACMILRNQFEGSGCPLVWFNIKKPCPPNLMPIRFNANMKHFIHREMDVFTDKDFDFIQTKDGYEAYPTFDDFVFNREIYHPSYIHDAIL